MSDFCTLFTMVSFEHVDFWPRCCKVHIFWEGLKILRNLHLTFAKVKVKRLALHRTKVRWKFCKILWPSQNIWTLYEFKNSTIPTLHSYETYSIQKEADVLLLCTALWLAMAPMKLNRWTREAFVMMQAALKLPRASPS